MFRGPGMLLATVFFTNYCRIIQYSSKFVSWAMIQRGLSEDLVDKIKALERSVSTARKCESCHCYRARVSSLASIDALMRRALDYLQSLCRPSTLQLATM